MLCCDSDDETNIHIVHMYVCAYISIRAILPRCSIQETADFKIKEKLSKICIYTSIVIYALSLAKVFSEEKRCDNAGTINPAN